ncbi:MAG: SCO family protein [Bdellovibrio sp.]
MNKFSVFQVVVIFLLSTITILSLAKSYPSESIFHLKGEWLDSQGHKAHLSDLEGQVTAIALIYTSCQYSCPLIIDEFNQIKSKISPEYLAKINFVLFSMDPKRDTPEALRVFASKRKLDLSFWHLYTAKDEKSVQELSVVLGASIKKIGKEFAHSNLISVVGKEGLIVFSKPRLGELIDETASAINKSFLKVVKK